MFRFAIAFVFMFASSYFGTAQWSPRDAGRTASLHGIDSVAGTVVSASGTDGTVLKTKDG